MDFDEYQKQAYRTKTFKVQSPELTRHYLVAGLAAQIGEVANRLKKKLRDGGDYILLKDEVAERIGYALWYLAVLAHELGLNLDTIALRNLKFNERRWPQEADPQRIFLDEEFDASWPPDKRLPQRLIAHFDTVLMDGLRKTVVSFYPNWPSNDGRSVFGDPIDDNSTDEDHYRYHDIFHFAYVAFLGWSPVARALMGRKRKDEENPDVDRIQDGARAKDTEEAATAFIYSYVSQQNFLETSKSIDTGVLTTVRTLLRHYEVSVRAEKEWEAAILAASEVLRALVKNEGGWVEVNRSTKSLAYLGKRPPT